MASSSGGWWRYGCPVDRSLVVIYARPDRFVQLISQQYYIGNS
ncbi:hypothetical protein [Gilliamella apicola]